VVHVHHEYGDAHQRQHERGDHRHPRHLPRFAGIAQLDLPDRQQGVDERRHEEPDRELAGPVAEQALNDPG
jgi:hypothetical protein